MIPYRRPFAPSFRFILLAIGLIGLCLIQSCSEERLVTVSGWLIPDSAYSYIRPFEGQPAYIFAYCTDGGTILKPCNFDTTIMVGNDGRILFTYPEGMDYVEVHVQSKSGIDFYCSLQPNCFLLNQRYTMQDGWEFRMDVQGDCSNGFKDRKEGKEDIKKVSKPIENSELR